MMSGPEAGELRLIAVGRANIGPFSLKTEQPVTIGRGSHCQVCLPDPSISRHHAILTSREGQWRVMDQKSLHGTFLNGVRLEPERPMQVGDGDVLRIGPFAFRVSAAAAGLRAVTTTDDSVGPGTIVEQVPEKEFGSLAQRRLALIIEGSATIHQAANEADLGQTVVDLIVAGTGFPRAAMLRYLDSVEEVEVVAARDEGQEATAGFTFSRSLLMATAEGRMARLSRSVAHDYGQSIDRLGIATALCAPLIVDSAAVGAIYLDSRLGETEAQPEAVDFCHAVSRLASLALSSLKREELEERQKVLDADLKIAQRAQEFLLPAEEGAVGSLRYVVRTCPGRTVAGDLFDIFPLGESRVGICCGDVTGQGVGAAIMMTAVLSHLRAALARCADPAAAVNDVNAYIAGRSPVETFVSLWVGVYSADESLLDYVDAGHGHWAVRRRGEPPAPSPEPGGMVIGVNPDYVYEAERLLLAEGDRVILYSDGIIEHRNSEGELFGRARLLDLLGESGSVESDVTDSLAALQEFIGENDLADDTTIASVEVSGRA
ncbi:MAG: SpoIIE family protein phosphatase [Phycisphaerales bacterium]|nr:MAG: SpoIIE family protein phosphatase [Phycisphaerales bacterium]